MNVYGGREGGVIKGRSYFKIEVTRNAMQLFTINSGPF